MDSPSDDGRPHHPPFAARLATATLAANWSGIRWAPALRRGAVVVVVLVAGIPLVGEPLAAQAAIGALLVGLLDKGRSPRESWRVMTMGTVVVAAMTAAAGLLAGNVVGTLLLLAVLAFLCGTSIGVDPRAPQVFLFGSMMVVAHLGEPFTLDQAVAAALAVAAAGIVQTAVCAAAGAAAKDFPERRTLVAALGGVADLCSAVATAKENPALVARVTAAVTAAESFVARSDLAAEQRRNFGMVLADVEALRLHARALSASRAAGVEMGHNDARCVAMQDAADVLRVAAEALERFAPSETRGKLEAAAAVVATGPTPGIRAVQASTAESAQHVLRILDARAGGRHRRSTDIPLWTRIGDSLRPGAVPLACGLRMAAAAITGAVVAEALGLRHGAWVVVTAMNVLRPDVGPAAPRAAKRALGTAVGAAIVVVAAWATHGTAWQVVTIMAVAVVLLYAVTSVNYGLVVAMVTTVILLIITLGQGKAGEIALSRMVDVLVGCVVGIAFAWLFPLRKHMSLRRDAAVYVAAVRDWFAEMAAAAALDPSDRTPLLPEMAELRRKARATRVAFDASLSAALLELPVPGGTSPGTVATIVGATRKCSELGVAAAMRLEVGAPGSAPAATAAEDVASDLEDVRAILLGSAPSPGASRMAAPGRPDASDGLAVTMDHALVAADRARSMAMGRLLDIDDGESAGPTDLRR